MVVSRIADAIAAGDRVAIDGPDAAGKTTLADELAELLAARGTVTVRASIDGFHRPRQERLAAGELSPHGYLEDSFDLAALRRDLLEPLGPGGSRRIVRQRHDWRRDAPVAAEPEVVPVGAVLVVDGVFLLRRELADWWERSVFVFAPPEVTLQRARIRDADALGGVAEVERRYRGRYIPGQALYFARERPHERATFVLECSDPSVRRLDPGAVAEGVTVWIEEWCP